MQEKRYKFKTFDKEGNELIFDMTELQYLVKEELLKYNVPSFNQMMEILKLTDDKCNMIISSSNVLEELNKQI